MFFFLGYILKKKHMQTPSPYSLAKPAIGFFNLISNWVGRRSKTTSGSVIVCKRATSTSGRVQPTKVPLAFFTAPAAASSVCVKDTGRLSTAGKRPMIPAVFLSCKCKNCCLIDVILASVHASSFVGRGQSLATIQCTRWLEALAKAIARSCCAWYLGAFQG